MCQKTFATACSYVDAGFSVIPVRSDGTKAPAIDWKEYTFRKPTCRELHRWFFKTNLGIGMVAGVVSGGLEIFDFDCAEFFEPWRNSLPVEVAEKLTVIKSPCGWHVYYRCAEIGHSAKIAVDPNKPKSTLIETRGEASYVVAPGSPASCHSSGLIYEHYWGPSVLDLIGIPPSERRMLFASARAFDCRPEIEKQRLKAKVNSWDANRINSCSTAPEPIRWFNAKNTWPGLLEPHGWTSSDGIHWTRPGKRYGVSAKVLIAADGEEILAVHSSNAGPIAANNGVRKLNKFEASKWLNFSGDGRAAFVAAREVMS